MKVKCLAWHYIVYSIMASNQSTDYYNLERIKRLEHPYEKWQRIFTATSPWMMAPPNQPGAAIDPKYDTYHPFACHVCKRGPLQKVKLSKCSGCHILKYCCREHQKLDWGKHKQFCKRVSQIKKQRRDDIVVNDKASWKEDNTYMTNRLVSITSIHTVECGMYPMQPRCQKCYKAEADMPKPASKNGSSNSNSPKGSNPTPPNELIPCPRCYGVAMCRSCLESENDGNGKSNDKLTPKQFHANADNSLECDHHLNILLALGMTIDKGKSLVLASQHNCPTLFQPRNWHDYLKKKVLDFSMSSYLPMTPVLHFVTENLSFPLTIHHALFLDGVDRRYDKTKLIVHCIGAGPTEEIASRAFAEIARMNPLLEKVQIMLIGPDISYANENNNGRVLSLNNLLSEEEGEEFLNTSHATIHFWRSLYHDLEHKLEEPDLCVAFNCGFSDSYHKPNWLPTLVSIQKRNIPLVFTGYDAGEVREDTKLVVDDLQMDIIVHPSPNPFRSLRPYPDPAKIADVPFYYQNSCFSVVVGTT